MHRSEGYDRTRCLDCGAEVSDTRERAFAVGEDAVLCFGCAVRRGGNYDELHDRWEAPPHLEGLEAPNASSSRVWK